MNTRRFKNKKNKMTRKRKNNSSKHGKKWTTAIEKARITLSKTGSIGLARKSFRKQALTNARKLFGSVSSV